MGIISSMLSLVYGSETTQTQTETKREEEKKHRVVHHVTVQNVYPDANGEYPESESVKNLGTKLYNYINALEIPYEVGGKKVELGHCIMVAWLTREDEEKFTVNLKEADERANKFDFIRFNMVLVMKVYNGVELIKCNDTRYSTTQNEDFIFDGSFYYCILDTQHTTDRDYYRCVCMPITKYEYTPLTNKSKNSFNYIWAAIVGFFYSNTTGAFHKFGVPGGHGIHNVVRRTTMKHFTWKQFKHVEQLMDHEKDTNYSASGLRKLYQSAMCVKTIFGNGVWWNPEHFSHYSTSNVVRTNPSRFGMLFAGHSMSYHSDETLNLRLIRHKKGDMNGDTRFDKAVSGDDFDGDGVWYTKLDKKQSDEDCLLLDPPTKQTFDKMENNVVAFCGYPAEISFICHLISPFKNQRVTYTKGPMLVGVLQDARFLEDLKLDKTKVAQVGISQRMTMGGKSGQSGISPFDSDAHVMGTLLGSVTITITSVIKNDDQSKKFIAALTSLDVHVPRCSPMMCEKFGGKTEILTPLMVSKFCDSGDDLHNMIGNVYKYTVWKEHDLTTLCGTPPRPQHFWIPFGICILSVCGYFGWKKYIN